MSYSVTVNVLTVSVLHCDSIGILRQDSTASNAEGCEVSSGTASGADGGMSSFETNECLRQRYLKGLSAVCCCAGKRAKMEDLGGAVPTDHLLSVTWCWTGLGMGGVLTLASPALLAGCGCPPSSGLLHLWRARWTWIPPSAG